jgi:hypothetical protein
MHPLQEKFQVMAPARASDDDPGPWVSQTTARAPQVFRNDDWQQKRADDVDTRNFNEMPNGMQIDLVMVTSLTNGMPLSLAGSTDVTACCAPSALNNQKGYTKHEMKGTDDCYTGEHVDHFYGDSGGFVERNNYLDRM